MQEKSDTKGGIEDEQKGCRIEHLQAQTKRNIAAHTELVLSRNLVDRLGCTTAVPGRVSKVDSGKETRRAHAAATQEHRGGIVKGFSARRQGMEPSRIPRASYG